MGSLSNLYISQSYQSLIHLATNNTASATLIGLQDGLGNSIGVSVNTGGNLYLSGSLSASLQQGYAWVGDSNNRNTLVPTSSFGGATPAGTISSSAQITALGFVSSSVTASSLITASFSGNTLTFTKGDSSTFGVVIPDVSGSTINTGSFATTASFNAYTQSNDQRVSSLEVNSASVNTSITNINTATASLFSSASLALVTASFDTGTRNLTFTKGNTTQFSVNIPDVSGSTIDTGSFATTGSNTFNGNQNITGSLSISPNENINIGNEVNNSSGRTQLGQFANRFDINAFTGSYPDGAKVVLYNFESFNAGDATFTASLSQGYVWVGDSNNRTKLVATSSFGSTINTGSFVTTSSFNSYTSSTDNRLNNIETTTASLLIETNNLELFSASALISISNLNQSSASQQISIDALNVASASLQSFTSSQYVSNSYFATTGSNTFTGDQTLIDNAGNFYTISDASGSMMLVAKGFTSASAHISASAAGIGNIIFKTNNNTATTTLSGSNNIFTNTGNPTAGFRRYLTSGNISMMGALPQISASMAFSPTISNNSFINALATNNPLTIRGPISSSAYAINSNQIFNQVNLGSSAANNAEKIVAGISLNSNIIQTLSIVANRTNTTQTVSILNNQLQGTTTLNMNSSSIDLNNNLWYGTNTITNNSSGSSRVSAAGNAVGLTQNILLGTNTITFSGSNDVNDTQDLDYQGGMYRSMIIGTNTPFVQTGPTGSNSISNTAIIGNGLIVTGSSGNPVFGSDSLRHGSVFVGRFNDVSGNKDLTAETIFAVGTGTSTSARKTGFLIDSGSNTFVEGTFNVSGSSTFAGAQTVTGSVTISGSLLSVDRSGNTNNVIIGLNALGMGSAGAQPLALGNTISIAIGSGAMRFASGSQQNVAIGNGTLQYTTGSKNTAIGGASLTNNTTGQENLAIGLNALTSNTLGGTNIAIGNNAGFRNVSGSNNTYIGESAGYNILGSSNVIIGRYQGSIGEKFDNNIILADGSGNIRAQHTGSVWLMKSAVNFTTGSNQQAGTAVLDGANPGTVTVSNSLVTANSIIMVSKQTLAHPNGYVAVSAKSAGSFTITSNHNGDTDTVGWFIINNS